MSKVCYLCGKSTVAGRSIQHKHFGKWGYKAPRTTRHFKPNIRNIDVEVDGQIISMPTCMKCYKKLRKESEEK